MLCSDVPPPEVLFDIVDVSSASCFNLIIPGIYSSPTATPTPRPPFPCRLSAPNFLPIFPGAIDAIFLLPLWIIPGIYSSPIKTLSPPHLPTLPCQLVVARLSANLKCRPPRCYWCNLGTPMISTPSVYQVFYFRFSTCSHEDDHTDWRRPFRQSYGLMRWWFHNEVDIFISWDQTTAKEKRPIPTPPQKVWSLKRPSFLIKPWIDCLNLCVTLASISLHFQ